MTHELAARADADGALRWRVSVTDISRDGPFSMFPGYDRQTALLAGAGCRIGSWVLSAADPLAGYGGDVPLECVLTAGPARVLNVFTARGRASSRVAWSPVRGATVLGIADRELVALCVDGDLVCAGVRLGRYDCARSDRPIACDGVGMVLLVTLDRNAFQDSTRSTIPI